MPKLLRTLLLLLLITTLLLVLLPLVAAAQHIPLKTAPAAGDAQFFVLPSERTSMGGVQLALDDPLQDAFANPARGVALPTSLLSAAPTYYHYAGGNGAATDAFGQTLPVSLLLKGTEFFGGGSVAWQRLTPPSNILSESERATSNLYVATTAGAQLPGSGLALGIGISGGLLNSLDHPAHAMGVHMHGAGSFSQFRFGAYLPADDDGFTELLVLHHRSDLRYGSRYWISPAPQSYDNKDRTRGWAVQLGHRRTLQADWRLGGRLVGNWNSHGQMATYRSTSSLREPGSSSAYRLGVGAAYAPDRLTLAADLVYEPAFLTAVLERSDPPIIAFYDPYPGQHWPPAGIVEQDYRFHNGRLRLGAAYEIGRLLLESGLQARHTRLRMHEAYVYAEPEQTHREAWTEWTASLGIGIALAGARIQYQGFLKGGTGRLLRVPYDGVMGSPTGFVATDAQAVSIAPPLERLRTFTHRLQLRVPLAR